MEHQDTEELPPPDNPSPVVGAVSTPRRLELDTDHDPGSTASMDSASVARVQGQQSAGERVPARVPLVRRMSKAGAAALRGTMGQGPASRESPKLSPQQQQQQQQQPAPPGIVLERHFSIGARKGTQNTHSQSSLQRAGEESLGTEEDLYSDRDERVAVQLPEMVRSSSLDAIDLFGSGPGGGVSRPFYAIELNDLQINHMDDRSLDGEEDVQSRMSVEFSMAAARENIKKSSKALRKDIKKLYRRKKERRKKRAHVFKGEMAEEEDLIIQFLLDLARGMLLYGAPSHEVESILTEVCELFSLQSNFFCTPTGLSCSISQSKSTKARTAVLRIVPAGLNLQKLSRMSDIAERVADGSMLPSRALRKIDKCIRTPDLFLSHWWTLLSSIIITTSITWAITSRGMDCLSAFFMSIPLSLLRVAAEHWRWNDAVHLTCQGLLSQTFAVIVNEYITEINLSGVVLSSIVSFLPGLTIAIATSELAAQNFVAGLSRMIGGFLGLIELAVGMLIARQVFFSQVALQSVAPPEDVSPTTEPLLYVIITMITVAFSALSLNISLRVHRKYFLLVLLSCWCSFWSAWATGRYISNLIGSVVGAMVSVIFGNIDAILSTRAAALTAVPGMIMVVPGSVAFRGVFSIVSNDATAGLASISSMAIIALGISIGSYLGSLFWPATSGIFTAASKNAAEEADNSDEEFDDLSSQSSAVTCSDLEHD